MSWTQILFEAGESGIAQLTINRPSKLNALNSDTMSELDEVFAQMEREPDLRGLIITGAGDKAFVAGADIKEFVALSPAAMQKLASRGQHIFRRLETMNKPSIAAVNGFALGGGLELAMCCSVRVASPNAKFGQPEVKLGIIPGYGGTQRLPRLVGRGRALEMLLTGDPIDAAEAHRIGLVNHVVAQDQLLTFSRDLLKKMLSNGSAALMLAMQSVDAGLDSPLDDALRFEAAAFGVAASTDDSREGTAAFLEKRKPVFVGK